MAEGAPDPEDKTEEPSQRRLDQAVERGDVAKSQELNTLFVLAAGTLAVMMAGPSIARELAVSLRGILANIHQVGFDGRGLAKMWDVALGAGLMALALPLGLIVVAGIGANMMQHRLVISTEKLMPDLSRLSPMAGFKRMFGKEALVNLLKGMVKISIVGILLWAVMRSESDRLDSITRIEPGGMLPVMLAMFVKLMGAVLAVYAFIAMGDYVYQRYTWYQRQRMSKQELKQEYKETEGNPEIKSKISQLRRRMARRRMMQAVPKASVVITNPTHYAVALQYDAGMEAPVCVAKGVDSLALKIREIAAEHQVPIVENPPLARALHKSVEIDDTVPEEHYKAVAEVIGMVLRLRGRRA